MPRLRRGRKDETHSRGGSVRDSCPGNGITDIVVPVVDPSKPSDKCQKPTGDWRESRHQESKGNARSRHRVARREGCTVWIVCLHWDKDVEETTRLILIKGWRFRGRHQLSGRTRPGPRHLKSSSPSEQNKTRQLSNSTGKPSVFTIFFAHRLNIWPVATVSITNQKGDKSSSSPAGLVQHTTAKVTGSENIVIPRQPKQPDDVSRRPYNQ